MSSVVGFWRTGELKWITPGMGANLSTIHSTAAESFSLDIQEAEENFDLALVAALEIDVVPYLGDGRVPDFLVSQLGKVLQQGSQVYEYDGLSSSSSTPGSPSGNSQSSSGFEKIDIDGYREKGSTEFGSVVPRERFSYWCFDLLFLICSDTTKGMSALVC